MTSDNMGGDDQPKESSLPEGPVINPDNNSSSANKISLSIFLAALVIAGSVFYNSKIIINKLDGIDGKLNQSQVLGDATKAAVPDDGPVTVPDRRDQPTIGNANARVVVYEFSDFQCPFCTAFFRESYPQIKSQYIDTGKIKFVYRHFPLINLHPKAQKAAEAAECANRQGKFEDYFTTLFTNSRPDGAGLSIADLKSYSANLGLDTAVFNKCLDNAEAAGTVNKDESLGVSIGVEGTPTFVINGKKIVGAQPFENFAQAIDQALK